jgi:hypothetical protein
MGMVAPPQGWIWLSKVGILITKGFWNSHKIPGRMLLICLLNINLTGMVALENGNNSENLYTDGIQIQFHYFGSCLGKPRRYVLRYTETYERKEGIMLDCKEKKKLHLNTDSVVKNS